MKYKFDIRLKSSIYSNIIICLDTGRFSKGFGGTWNLPYNGIALYEVYFMGSKVDDLSSSPSYRIIRNKV